MSYYDDDPDWMDEDRQPKDKKPICMICGERIYDEKCLHFTVWLNEDYVHESCFEDALSGVCVDLRSYIEALVHDECREDTPEDPY